MHLFGRAEEREEEGVLEEEEKLFQCLDVGELKACIEMWKNPVRLL